MSTFTLHEFLILNILPCVFYTLLLLYSKYAEKQTREILFLCFSKLFLWIFSRLPLLYDFAALALLILG